MNCCLKLEQMLLTISESDKSDLFHKMLQKNLKEILGQPKRTVLCYLQIKQIIKNTANAYSVDERQHFRYRED